MLRRKDRGKSPGFGVTIIYFPQCHRQKRNWQTASHVNSNRTKRKLPPKKEIFADYIPDKELIFCFGFGSGLKQSHYICQADLELTEPTGIKACFTMASSWLILWKQLSEGDKLQAIWFKHEQRTWKELAVGMCTYQPSAWEGGKGRGIKVLGHPCLGSKFESSQGYRDPASKTQRLEYYFSQDSRIVNKHTKRCWIRREIQSKWQGDTLSSMPTTIKTLETAGGAAWGKTGTRAHCRWEWKMVQLLWKVWRFLKN